MIDFYEKKKDDFLITTDPHKIDVNVVYELLNATYWAQGRSIGIIQKSIDYSLCFSLLDQGKQVGFLRVVTDRAVYAYLCDIVIDEQYRGRGMGKWMLQCVFEHPDLLHLKRWSLVTKDAHDFYKQFGFKELSDANKYMEIVDNTMR